jgi:hypothetical protein
MFVVPLLVNLAIPNDPMCEVRIALLVFCLRAYLIDVLDLWFLFWF